MALFSKKNKQENEAKADEKSADAGVGKGVVALPKGGDASAYRIIVGPRITEKGSIMGAMNKYVFQVARNAGKIEIKKAISKLYNVTVTSVNILKAPSKHRRVGRHEGTKPGFKKAIVTLAEGSKIDIAT